MQTLRAAMEEFLQDWRRDVAEPWREFLTGIEPAFEAIDESLTVDAGDVIFPGRKDREPAGAPKGSHVFRALDGISPTDVRVIVIGQDPYPRVSRATGRAFEQGDLASWTGADVAMSLRRIMQCVAQFRTGRDAYTEDEAGWAALVVDVRNGSVQFAGPRETFDAWQHQGVLWLNTGLTLTRYQQGGDPHQLLGHIPLWAPVVAAICQRLAEREDTPVVFLSWGSQARRFLAGAGVLESATRPLRVVAGIRNAAVVDRDHPAMNSFTASPNLFHETNEKLSALGVSPIDW